MRKKLFAVIMSVMMMVTFMPAMAFAGSPEQTKVVLDSVKYGNNFATATAYCHTDDADQTPVTITGRILKGSEAHFDEGGSGAMKVTFDFKNESYYTDEVTKYYYDFNNASIVSSTTGKAVTEVNAIDLFNTDYTIVPKTAGIPAHYDLSDIDGTPVGNAFRFRDPEDSLNYVTVPFTTLFNTTSGTLKDVANVWIQTSNYELYDEGEYEFPVYIAKKDASDRYTEDEDIESKVDGNKGMITASMSPLKVKVTVPADAQLDGVNVTVDGSVKPLSTTMSTPYTGKNVEVKTVTKGVTVKYQLEDFSGKTTDWSETFPEIKDAGSYMINVQATKTFGDKASEEFSCLFTVKARECYPEFAGTYYEGAYGPSGVRMTFHEGQKIENKDLVSLYGCNSDNTTDPWLTSKVKLTEEDQATWNKIVEKYVVVDGVKDIVGEHQVEGYLSTAVFADTDEDVIKFLANNVIMAGYYDTSSSVWVLNAWDTSHNYKFDDGVVVIVEGKNDVTAINQSRTFHVKNAKALKAKKTFKLKGDEADWGTLTYKKLSGNSKISVSKAGKVTVKKGLKKGTYTVKIKVKAPGDSATKTLKVKIKK